MQSFQGWTQRLHNTFFLNKEAEDPQLHFEKSLFVYQLVFFGVLEAVLAGLAFYLDRLPAGVLHSFLLLVTLLSLLLFKRFFSKIFWSAGAVFLLVFSAWMSLYLNLWSGTLLALLFLPTTTVLLVGIRSGWAALVFSIASLVVLETFFLKLFEDPGLGGVATAQILFFCVSLGCLALFLLSHFLLRLVLRTMRSLHDQSKETEDRFLNQINFLQTLMDLIPFPLFYKDLNGHFLNCNASFFVIFDTTRERVYGRTNAEVLGRENSAELTKIELEVLSRETMAAEEAKLVHADGNKHDFIVYFMPFLDSKQSLEGYIGVLIDITERKSKEEKLLQLNATKDQLFSIISHDLRGPVGKVKQLLDVYITDPDIFDATTWKQVFFDMRKSTDSLFQLLENLLSWARAQKGDSLVKLEVFPLEPLITEVFSVQKLLSTDKNIELKMEVNLQAPLQSDKTILSTIIRNLVNNALKFTPHGGQVTVRAREIDQDVRIEVEDTGLGMTAELIEKILKKREHITNFGTSKEKGQGLGLNLCLDLAEMIGARLEVESKPGIGTIFSLDLLTPEL